MITAAEVEVLSVIAGRFLDFIEKMKSAHDEGRSLTQEEIDSFVAADDASILRAKEAYERAKSEGR